MISDYNCNKVYFSELMKNSPKYKKNFQQIISVLEANHINFDFLKSTKDIWARDYMPIQVNKKKFIEYRYDPDYLQGKKYRSIKSYSDIVCFENNIETIKTDIIIDGGNVIKSEHAVIMTDKVVEENKANYKKDALIEKLYELFETDRLALIPWDKENDYLGHADGMLRFINNNSVLIQGYFEDYDSRFKDLLYSSLENAGISWTPIHYEVENSSVELNWAYLNFLQLNDLILVPQFGIDEDKIALKKIRSVYSQYKSDKIIGIEMNDIVAEGGALNCISWSIYN